MILNGKNLGERQKDLNSRVNDAVARKVNFDIIKEQKEVSDVDVLFKIDIAAKYKNTEYILEILKSEDSLHITRALKKCDWLYDDEHSYIINVDYLHNDVFPHMSTKMKRKMLTTISTHVKDETRAETFYKYCKKEKLQKIADKFLLHTSEGFKLNFIKNADIDSKYCKKEILKSLLGNSFTLAEAYLKVNNEYSRDKLLINLSYLYYESNDKYLNFLEKYKSCMDFYRLGPKITKDIAIKHKNRVLQNLDVYLRRLDVKTLLKHSNLEEVKKYAAAKLLKTAQQFWQEKYWKKYKLILSKIPTKEKFHFVKEIFTNKYPGEKFETSDEFYTSGSYNLMTKKQKIDATKNFENEEGNISRIKRNIWYKNVHFDKAFSKFEEKMLNNRNRKTRTNLLIALIKASKSQQNLIKVLNYYNAIYKTEKVSDKEKFLAAIFLDHNVFEFDTNCWTVLQKMLLDEEVCKIQCYPEKKYESIVYLYHILHNKEFPIGLKSFLDTTSLSSLSAGIKKLNKNQTTKAFEYLFQYHVNRLNELEDTDYDFDNKVKKRVCHHVHSVINLITCMDKSKDDIPEIVQRYLLSDWEEFCHYDVLKDDQNNFMKRLKRDASTVKHFQTLKENLADDPDFNLIPVLRKVKIYFSHDIAIDFLKFFEYCLSENNLATVDEYEGYELSSVVKTAIIGIYMLANESYKKEIMLHFKPETDKIDYTEMDEIYLNIQEAVCSFGYFSRPPLPTSCLSIYLKGDYALRCLPTIGSLFANLPRTSCLQLAQTILSAPESNLKYNFHLVLHHLSVEDLKEVVINVWENTEHGSVRRDLITLMYRAIQKQNKKMKIKLFACFKEMILGLRENDDEKCFKFLDDDELMPTSRIKEDLLEAAWESISKFEGFDALKTRLRSYIFDDDIVMSEN